MKLRGWMRWLTGMLAVALLFWYGRKSWHLLAPPPKPVPAVAVQRGNVVISVYASGPVEGGESEQLSAPMIGGGDLHLTSLLESGAPVQPGEIVAQFDTTTQEYNLQQAQADLAEAQQQVLEAQAKAAALEEQNRYALIQAKDAVRLAALDVRRNPLVSAIDAHKNDLALEAARDNLTQLQHDLSSQQANDRALIAQQQAAEQKARMQAQMAQKNIDAMTLRAKTSGYVALRQNTAGNFFFNGMRLPDFQVGDQVNPGMTLAEIPNTQDWTIRARVGELDRGHLAPGQKAVVTLAGIPGQEFAAHIQYVGGSVGPPWDRHSDCTLALDSAPAGLHAGMLASVRIITDRLQNVLWVPAQAVFEQSGHSIVYLRTGGSFVPHEIKVLRRSESQVVVNGLQTGQQVALTNPTRQHTEAGNDQHSAMEGLAQ